MARASIGGRGGLDVALGLDSGGKEISKSSQKLLKARLEAEKKMKLLYDKQYHDLSKKEQEKYLEQLRKLQDNYSKQSLKDKLEEANQKAKIEYESANNVFKKTAALGKQITTSFASNIGKAVGQAMDKGLTDINKYVDSYGKYISSIQTRLQGSGRDYFDITSKFSRNLSTSPYVSQEKLLNNLNTLVGQGIAYNVDQRAFLMTVSENIASTFDAANGTLLRLIKIQQADSTAARLGLETSLNQFLNKMFQDTSYLNNLSKSVSSAIIDANSQLSRNQSLEFEYQAQKWLGALSSVGVSESTISAIAQGIGYLGSGNISALSSNNALQSLLIMASNIGGVDYSSMLTGGMNAADVNALMKGIVTYGRRIAGSGSQVQKSALAQMFGMSISDLTSMLNLSPDTIESISKKSLNYSGALEATQQGLSTIGQRLSLAEKIRNVYGNVMSSLGESIASNSVLYSTWLLADMLQKSGADPKVTISTPMKGLFGGADIDTSVATIAKQGIVGAGLMTKIGAIVNGVSKSARLGLSDWYSSKDETNITSRGLISSISDDLHKGISESFAVGSKASEMGLSVTETTPEVFTGAESDIKEILENSIDVNIQTIAQTITSIDTKLQNMEIALQRQG